MEDIILGTLLFGGGTLFLLAISPVGRAVAERIRRGGASGPDAVLDRVQESQLAVLEEVDALRQELTDVQERLDFAERMLLKGREAGALPPGDEGER